jgi:hypothetical protein
MCVVRRELGERSQVAGRQRRHHVIVLPMDG